MGLKTAAPALGGARPAPEEPGTNLPAPVGPRTAQPGVNGLFGRGDREIAILAYSLRPLFPRRGRRDSG